MEINKVTIIGAGLMGNSIAQVFASIPNIEVVLNDVQLSESPYDPIKNNMDIMIDKGVLTEQEKEEMLDRITFETNLENAVKDADFVIEAITERLNLKQDLFEQIESFSSPDTIIGTNSSVISSTEISEKVKNRNRTVGIHFWNPAHLIPLVEVIQNEYTDSEVVDAVMNILEKAGKKPIHVKKDVPGFVGNRLQHALWREAFHMVDEGIADPKTIDDAVKYGFGLRLPVLGPMENSDMVGIPLSYDVHEYILKHLADNHEPSPTLSKLIEKNELGFSTNKGWQTWTDEEIENSNRSLREYLIDKQSEFK